MKIFAQVVLLIVPFTAASVTTGAALPTSEVRSNRPRSGLHLSLAVEGDDMQPRPYVLLLLAAILEVAGDTIIREALARWDAGWKMLAPLGLVAGIAVLGAYGVFVNKAPLPFGTTLGLYVAFFGVVGVLVGFIRDRQIDWWTAGGVAIIVVGGFVINHGERIRAAAAQAG